MSPVEDYTSIFFGDLNTRFGQHMSQLIEETCSLSYDPVDNVSTLLPHGKKTIKLAKDCELLVVNNLKHESSVFKGALSFRKKNRHICEPFIARASS